MGFLKRANETIHVANCGVPYVGHVKKNKNTSYMLYLLQICDTLLYIHFHMIVIFQDLQGLEEAKHLTGPQNLLAII